jgi:hypothetical protein
MFFYFKKASRLEITFQREAISKAFIALFLLNNLYTIKVQGKA